MHDLKDAKKSDRVKLEIWEGLKFLFPVSCTCDQIGNVFRCNLLIKKIQNTFSSSHVISDTHTRTQATKRARICVFLFS